jgi:hypothetical protein
VGRPKTKNLAVRGEARYWKSNRRRNPQHLSRFLLGERCFDGFYINILDGWLTQQLFDGVYLVGSDGTIPFAFTL